MRSRRNCRSCGKLYWPNSAKQTHYCSVKCGDNSRNKRKSENRRTLQRNIQILQDYNIPLGNTREVDMSELERRGFDADVNTLFHKIHHADGITISAKIAFGPYVLYNENHKYYVKFL